MNVLKGHMSAMLLLTVSTLKDPITASATSQDTVLQATHAQVGCISFFFFFSLYNSNASYSTVTVKMHSTFPRFCVILNIATFAWN